MKINDILRDILVTRHFLVEGAAPTDMSRNAYYNAYLLTNFGIAVDEPKKLRKEHLAAIANIFKLTVPSSFYSNPQDLRYFTKEELLIEQVVSYFVGYGTGVGRIEMFKKDLPEYTVGDELKLRIFNILSEEEAVNKLVEIYKAYCAYTRPFSNQELEEFSAIYNAFAEDAFLSDFCAEVLASSELKCKENIISMLPKNRDYFARFLDRKDLVKMSVQAIGEVKDITPAMRKQLAEIAELTPLVKPCPMSKKQAKFYNKLCSMGKKPYKKQSNRNSPDRLANILMQKGDVVGAARVYAENGSMLQRRLRYVLSRANLEEAIEILEMLPTNNPIAMYQFLTTMSRPDTDVRTFTFFKNNLVRRHKETDYEYTYRKSRLNATYNKLVETALTAKIFAYYAQRPICEKVYVAPNFYKLGLPTNTSAGGRGIDVLPTGSRLAINTDYVRTFVHWTDAFDIDSSLMIVDNDDKVRTYGWFNYGSHRGKSTEVMFSGDITGRNGAEYFDIDLAQMRREGVKYVVQTFHGYCSKLNDGEIYAGYQVKDNFNSAVWDPKNIETKFKVFGDTRACAAFAIDVQANEVVILNLMIDDDSRVVSANGFDTIKKYLVPEYLKVNIGEIAELAGTSVATPDEADLVFDDEYEVTVADGEEPRECKIIRSWELEKLVQHINR